MKMNHCCLDFKLKPFSGNASVTVIRLIPILLLLLASCSPKNPFNQSYVAQRVKNQSQLELIKEKKVGRFDLPPNVNVQDGISEDEAVTIALWNNAQFQTDMLALRFAQADLTEAGQMQNPTFRYLSPSGGIVAQVITYFYVDAILQRPFRIAAVKRDAKKIADNLVQRTFILVRDVQSAYADLKLAREKAKLFQESTIVRAQIGHLASSRLRNGDISELEATAAQIDSVSAVESFLRLAQDTVIMKNRFNNLLGFNDPDSIVKLSPAQIQIIKPVSKSDLLELAYSNSPEIQATMASIDAAGKRLGWERSRIMAYSLVLNGQNFSTTPTDKKNWPQTFDLGTQIEIPIFNRNRGRILRAKAELEQASFQYLALRQKIALDISEFYERYQVALQSYQLWDSNVVPSLEQATKLANDNYETGDVSYLPVLENQKILIDAKIRKAEVTAELRKAVAQLNLRIGKIVLN